MDVAVLKDVVIGAAAVLAAALAIWNFFQSPSKKNEGDIATLRSAIDQLRKETAEEIRTVDDKADSIGGRVSTLETMMRSMPDKDSQHKIELGIMELRGDFKMLSERLAPIDNLSRRLQEVLLDRAK